MTTSAGSIRTIFVHEDGPYAVVWEYGPVIYLHEWANDRLGEQIDARLLADHLRVRSVHAAALQWLVAPEPDEHDEEFDDDEGVPDASRTLVGVGGQDGEERAFVATTAVRGPDGHVYLHRDDRFECVRCDAAVLDWRTPARTETLTGRSESPAGLFVG